MMDLHRRLYRFHVLLKVDDTHKSHVDATQIVYCLVVCWYLSIQKKKKKLKIVFSKVLAQIDNNDTDR